MGERDNKHRGDAPSKLTKIPVAVDRLFLGLRIPFDVFLKQENKYVHLFTKWTHFDEATKAILDEKGIRHVYIEGTASTIEAYFKHAADIKPAGVDPKKFYEYSRRKEELHHIDKTILVDKNLFVTGTTINFSIFAINNMAFEMLVEASENAPVAIPKRVLTVKGDLAIKVTDVPLYQDYLNRILSAPDIPETLKQKGKAISLKENSKILIRDVLANPQEKGKIEELGGLVNTMIDSVINMNVTAADLMSLKNHDLYTYTHSVNVTVMSITLGIAVGFDRNKIEKLALGAMLHDIGKSRISPDILNKQGELTDQEFSIMKTHVAEGVRILDDNTQIPRESLIPVLQHHERLSGRGYPFGLSGKAIKPFGRIAAIVDCYDYLTTPRPYRYAYTPYMTLSLLAKETKGKGDFDQEYLKAFIQTLAIIS